MTGKKRKPVLISKYKNPRCFKNKNFKNISYYANKKAWMNSSIFKEILINWDSELIKINRKILLLVDNCSAHVIDLTILKNINLVFLPPNCTSVLQPLDNGILKN